MAKILYRLDILDTDRLVETSGLNLTGQYVGQTKTKVQDQLGAAKGGILFIDEAYELGKGPFGEEAMTSIVAAMTDPQYRGLVIIIAGYPADLDEMLNRNAGLKSRFNHFMEFEDWEAKDCVEFFGRKAEEDQFCELSDNVLKYLKKFFTHLRSLDGFGNGRDVMKFYQKVEEARANRVVDNLETKKTFTIEDVKEASDQFLRGRESPNVKMLVRSTQPIIMDANHQYAIFNPPEPPSLIECDVRNEQLVSDMLTLEDCLNEYQSSVMIEEVLDNEEVDSGTLKRAICDDGWEELHPSFIECDVRSQQLVSDILSLEDGLSSVMIEEVVDVVELLDSGTLKRAPRDAGVSDEDWEELQRAIDNYDQHLRDLAQKREMEKLEQERRKKEAFQSKIRRLCPCPMGYEWHQVGSGWRCGGGSHFVSNAELERNFMK